MLPHMTKCYSLVSRLSLLLLFVVCVYYITDSLFFMNSGLGDSRPDSIETDITVLSLCDEKSTTGSLMAVDKENIHASQLSRHVRKSFKEKKTFNQRTIDARNIRIKFPTKLPVILPYICNIPIGVFNFIVMKYLYFRLL